MNVITIDLETYWSVTHSLTKMNPLAYIMHPETEIQSIAIKVGSDDSFVLFGEDEIKQWAESTDFSDALVIGHNLSGFDGPLAAWRLGIKPKRWGCTQAMARQLGVAKLVGGSLKNVSAYFGVGEKLNLEATNTKGKKLKDFSPEEINLMREYNKVDTDLCYEIFKKMAPRMDARSMRLMDMTIRMMTEPKFVVDTYLLTHSLADLENKREATLLEVGKSLSNSMTSMLSDEEIIESARSTLASQPKFKALLEQHGVEVPMKPSPSNPDKMIPALSKTDEGMLELLDHDDPEIASLAAARLGVKSTQLGTRMEAFLTVSKIMGGKMPICLSYYGAQNTGRWSGTMKLNHQNLPRVGKTPKLSDTLRKSLRAPEGHKVVVADLSGIELRMNHFLWKVPSSMALFQADPAKADLYKDFASKLYNKLVDEVTDHERQVGKVSHLGLGYGSGPATFQKVAKIMGGVKLTLEEAEKIVARWRAAYPHIVAGWKRSHQLLAAIAQGKEGVAFDPWGLCVTAKGGIKTPQGFIHYPHLRQEVNDDNRIEWVYGKGKNKTRIYAGKIVENLVQHLAREAMADMMLKVAKKYPIVHTVHDEIVLIVPDAEAEEALAFMQDVMRQGVNWFPELLTWSEGGIGASYGEAKS